MIHYKEQGEFLCRVTSSYTDISQLFRIKKKLQNKKYLADVKKLLERFR